MKDRRDLPDEDCDPLVAEGMALLEAFRKVDDPSARHSIIVLLRALGRDQPEAARDGLSCDRREGQS